MHEDSCSGHNGVANHALEPAVLSCAEIAAHFAFVGCLLLRFVLRNPHVR